jgi:hypothetical protein
MGSTLPATLFAVMDERERGARQHKEGARPGLEWSGEA